MSLSTGLRLLVPDRPLHMSAIAGLSATHTARPDPRYPTTLRHNTAAQPLRFPERTLFYCLNIFINDCPQPPGVWCISGHQFQRVSATHSKTAPPLLTCQHINSYTNSYGRNKTNLLGTNLSYSHLCQCRMYQ